jgi:hypothetical protein
VIANFEEVFEFLLIDKSVQEIQDFIKSFQFILPKFTEPSEVFIMRKNYNIMEKKPEESKMNINERKRDTFGAVNKKRERFMSFNPVGPNSDDTEEVLGVINRTKEVPKTQMLKDKSMLGGEHEGQPEKCYLW